MPKLAHSLKGHDLGHLRIVAELWGIELEEVETNQAVHSLQSALSDRELVIEVIETLPSEAQAALEELLQHEGQLPWPLFTRRYGEIREMGAGRRDRERPYLSPSSPTEVLWYRALIARDFLDSSSGPQEYAYIPDELFAVLPRSLRKTPSSLGRASTPTERVYPIPANDHLLDHACTLLSALRLGLNQNASEFKSMAWKTPHSYALTPKDLSALLVEAEIINPEENYPVPDNTRHFLELDRGKALAYLTRTWMHSTLFNELRQLPGLQIEGEWHNDPLRTRYTILEFLSFVPRSTWWSLPAFIADIKESQPDFQRPAGDYDSWYLRDAVTGNFLRGFEYWDEIDGNLIRYIITGPLHWLGIIDLAAPGREAPPSAFKFSNWADDLLNGAPPQELATEDDSLLISSDARLRVPRLVARTARYQVARFCNWEGEKDGVYAYRITPASLERARKQGLQVSHLIKLLNRYALAVPPSLVTALERWEEHGSEARLEDVIILRVRSPKMLKSLQKSRAARFLGDPIGPTVITVKPGAQDKVLSILSELGYLGEGITDENW